MAARDGERTVGLALSPTTVTASEGGTIAPVVRDVAFGAGNNGAHAALGAAVAELAKGAPSVAVALLPPLADVRSVELPPLGESERNQLLARSAPRYFVDARGPQVVASAAPARSNGGPAPVLAAATGQAVVAAVEAAAVDAGVAVRRLVPAEAAWAAAALAIWPSLARGAAVVAIVHDARTDLLMLADGALAGVRRLRAGAAAARAIADAVKSSGARVAVAGMPDQARALIAALGGSGLLLPDVRWAGVADSPAALAAAFAAAARTLGIRTEASRTEERAAVRRAAWTYAGLAVAALLLAAGVYYRGVQREVTTIRAQREALKSQVDATLVGRSSVDAAYRQVAALATAAREAPRWSGLFAAVAMTLRTDASLTALRVRGDSLFVDGVANSAAPVFDDLARVPGIVGVRATAPVRREAVEGDAPLEHFSIGAQLKRGSR